LSLSAITLFAATVNGAIGYGFSSITVPLALLFLTNRVLTPALVPIELVLNAYVLWVNRESLPVVWRRALPIIVGLLPGVLVGTAVVSGLNPAWLKLGTLGVLLPLILLQAAGYRRPIRSERAVGLGVGCGIGVLYATTTISGPPLAIVLNNQGLTRRDFRAALGLIRLAESSFTAVAYLHAGLYSDESMRLIPYIVPSIAIGVPLGARLIRSVKPESFRRVCISFDAWIVAFGLSILLRDLHLIPSQLAFLPLVGVVFIDGAMLRRFFGIKAPLVEQAPGARADLSRTPVISVEPNARPDSTSAALDSAQRAPTL
jgi:uncharacterized membrane protein YfcA